MCWVDFAPILERILRNKIYIKREEHYRKWLHRVLETIEIGSVGVVRSIFVSYCANDGARKGCE